MSIIDIKWNTGVRHNRAPVECNHVDRIGAASKLRRGIIIFAAIDRHGRRKAWLGILVSESLYNNIYIRSTKVESFFVGIGNKVIETIEDHLVIRKLCPTLRT